MEERSSQCFYCEEYITVINKYNNGKIIDMPPCNTFVDVHGYSSTMIKKVYEPMVEFLKLIYDSNNISVQVP